MARQRTKVGVSPEVMADLRDKERLQVALWSSLDFSCGFLEQIAASDPRAEHVVIWDQIGPVF